MAPVTDPQTCPRCGRRMPAAARFCRRCGIGLAPRPSHFEHGGSGFFAGAPLPHPDRPVPGYGYASPAYDRPPAPKRAPPRRVASGGKAKGGWWWVFLVVLFARAAAIPHSCSHERNLRRPAPPLLRHHVPPARNLGGNDAPDVQAYPELHDTDQILREMHFSDPSHHTWPTDPHDRPPAAPAAQEQPEDQPASP